MQRNPLPVLHYIFGPYSFKLSLIWPQIQQTTLSRKHRQQHGQQPGKQRKTNCPAHLPLIFLKLQTFLKRQRHRQLNSEPISDSTTPQAREHPALSSWVWMLMATTSLRRWIAMDSRCQHSLILTNPARRFVTVTAR